MSSTPGSLSGWFDAVGRERERKEIYSLFVSLNALSVFRSEDQIICCDNNCRALCVGLYIIKKQVEIIWYSVSNFELPTLNGLRGR